MAEHKLIHGDCLDWLSAVANAEPIACIFADPPDNIGLKYDEYKDRLPAAEYEALLRKWVERCVDCAGITWVSFNSRYLLEMASTVRRLCHDNPTLEFKPCVQTFTFGQYNQNDLSNNHRLLWRLRWDDAPLYPEQIKVPSWREENGDPRAKAGGRVPGDVFDFTRVTGNSKQRRAWHPTQLNEGLYERCIKMSTAEGDHVCDPFGGTGTALRVCKRINRSCTLIETSSDYCSRIAAENDLPWHSKAA